MSDQTPFTDLGDALLYTSYLAALVVEDTINELDEEHADPLAKMVAQIGAVVEASFKANGRAVPYYKDGTRAVTVDRTSTGTSVVLGLPNQGGDQE